MRDSKVTSVSSTELVPADAAVINSNDLIVNESVVTREAYPIENIASST